MSLSFLAPLFLAGLLAVAVPVIVHLIRRHRGTPVEFPSLMFLRRLPVRSVRRRRIHNWPLLLLRAAALALIAAAFARPVLEAGDTRDGGAGDAFRDVVVVLDRSWSMGLGDRWERARQGVREALSGVVAPDRVALVLFERTGSVVVEPTLDPTAVLAVLDTLSPGWDVARLGAGLQAAAGILDASDRSRREVVLVSDFQRRAWEDGPRDPLPAGTRLVPVDVGAEPVPVVAVAEVGFQHRFEGDRQQVHPRVRIVRFGDGPAVPGRVTLRVDGRVQEELDVEIPGEGATAVELGSFLLPPEGIRGSVEVSRAGDTAMEPFRFVLSPGEILTVLLVETSGGSGADGLHLRSALSVGGDEPMQVVRRAPGSISPADLGMAHVILVNDTPLPGGDTGRLMRERIRQGTGLVVAAGARSAPQSWSADWDELLPGRPGAPVERDPARGTTLARVDRDHPVFLPFAVTGRSGLGAPRFFRYRSFEPAAAQSADIGAADTAAAAPQTDEAAPRILARFDDGTPALAERRAGEGRTLVWTSGLDTDWSDLPLHGVFLPLVQELVRYAAPRGEGTSRFEVGQALDRAFLRDRAGFEAEGGVLVPPGGTGLSLDDGVPGGPSALADPGFYEVRTDDGATAWTFAVNMDPAAADPNRVDPEELALALARNPEAAGDAEAPDAEGGLLAGFEGSTRDERERRQGAWQYLLAGALLLLVTETLVANRKKGSAPQLQTQDRT